MDMLLIVAFGEVADIITGKVFSVNIILGTTLEISVR